MEVRVREPIFQFIVLNQFTAWYAAILLMSDIPGTHNFHCFYKLYKIRSTSRFIPNHFLRPTFIMVFVHPTPEGRIRVVLKRLKARDGAIKTRVAAIAPEVCTICIIENQGSSDDKPGVGIQLCHAFPRRKALDSDIVSLGLTKYYRLGR
ncbi:hypothetical protein BJ165DRAFT_562338 [Panaeolus papilionaceus]|nr:hypothetical protein BJ165DRAFT_562338 [Panaeolus papilionaceus]